VKAVRIHEYGGPEVLRHEEVETPEPGPGQVRLKVHACALNHVDVDVRDGISRFPIDFPLTLGLEMVGSIDAVGAGVEGWSEGDRAMPYLLGGPIFLGVAGPGGFAEYVICPPEQLVAVPEGISDVDAAAIQVAFGTAWHMLFTRGGLGIGDTVLINSVSAGIGSAAVQLAKLAGATVIGTSSSDEKLAEATASGMDHGIDYTRQDVTGEVMRITGDAGVDLVFEHVGGDLFDKGLASVKPNTGRLVTCGAHAQEVVPFDIIPFFRAQWTIIGSFVYTREELEKVLDFARRGLITPKVAATYPLAEARAAMEKMESRDFFGKLILEP